MPAKPLEPLRRSLSLAEARVQAQLPATSTTPPRAARAANSNRHTIIVDVAQSVSPAVVSIGVTKTTYVRQYDPFGGDLFFTPYLISPLKQNFPYLGSGFIIDKQGHVVTNYHVVENSTSIYVTLTDKRTYPAKLLDADRFVDIALLQIQNLKGDEDLPVIAIGDSSDIMIGETVLAIGNPFGPLIADPRPSVSVGVVSAVNRTFNDLQHERIYQDMIQTDAAINPGNSGGPLVNLDRQAIGINTFIFSSSGESASVGFSIPISRVMKTVDEILRYGKVRALRSDFEYVTVTPYLVQALTLDVKSGVLIKSVDVGGPADRAGLQPGDVILAVNDKDMKTAEDLLSMLLAHSVGDQLKLTVVRQGQRRQLNYTLQEAKQP
jgi:serine protease Do